MGYGQYTEGTRHYYPERPRVGYRTKGEILAGVSDYVKAWKSAHNEFTRITHSGARIVRLIATDILWVSPSKTGFQICTGGWFTPTTVTHINDALAREIVDAKFRVWNEAKRVRPSERGPEGRGILKGEGRMRLLQAVVGGTSDRGTFKNTITLTLDSAGVWYVLDRDD